LTIKHDAKIESFFRMKSTAKQENKFNFKRNIYIPKMCVDLGPGGLQQLLTTENNDHSYHRFYGIWHRFYGIEI